MDNTIDPCEKIFESYFCYLANYFNLKEKICKLRNKG